MRLAKRFKDTEKKRRKDKATPSSYETQFISGQNTKKVKKWYKNNKIIISSIIFCLFLIFVIANSLSPLKNINIIADDETIYDINEEITLEYTTEKSRSLPFDAFQSSGGILVLDGSTLIFSAEVPGIYEIWAEYKGVTSNIVSLQIQNKLEVEAQKETLKELEENTAQTEIESETIQTVEPEMTIHFLDVGQGLSILVRSGEHTLIYDGGGRDKSSYVVSYLEKQFITDIDYLISSHYDEDHLAGLVGCLNAFNVKNVIGANDEHDSNIYHSFMNIINEKSLELQHPPTGTEFEFGTGKFTILSSETEDDDNNENSIVIKIENGDHSFILTGDAGSKSESIMCSSALNLEANVLSVSHHGSASSTSYDFLQEVAPQFAVISCGKNNQYGHPDKDTMDKLMDMGIEVFRTDIQGAIVVISNGKELRWDQNPCNDYSPGNKADVGTQPATVEAPSQSESSPSAAILEDVPEEPIVSESPAPATIAHMVWMSASGKKYHSVPDCGSMNPNNATQITQDQAESMGLGRCSKCY